MNKINFNYLTLYAMLMIGVSSNIILSHDRVESDEVKSEVHKIELELNRISKVIGKSGATSETDKNLEALTLRVKDLCDFTKCSMCKVHKHHLENRLQDMKRHAQNKRSNKYGSNKKILKQDALKLQNDDVIIQSHKHHGNSSAHCGVNCD